MNWQHPQAFYFILPLLCVWLFLALYARHRRRRAAERFVSAAMSPRILPADSGNRFWLKTGLWGGALVCGLLAIAQPQFGEYYEEVKVKGSDLYILVDVSRSMLADDVPPNRLSRAKSDISSLLNHLHGERAGLIAFAGRAAVKCPLTTDYTFFRTALNELGPNSVDRGGTAIGDAVRKALDVFDKNADRDQAILLITDGEDDQDSYPLDATERAAEQRVTIFTVGLGDTEAGSKIPLKPGQYLEYEGKPVVSKMDEKLLSEMALKTNGAYVPARTKAYDLGQLYDDHLARLRGNAANEQRRMKLREQYQAFLALAVLGFLFELLVRPYAARSARPLASSVGAKERNGGGLQPPPLPLREGGGGWVGIAMLLLLLLGLPPSARAADASGLVKDGLSAYGKDDFAEAGTKFSEAQKALTSDETDNGAIAAFDEGCALQRKGEKDKAREAYLRAGLAHDKTLAASAHFNLGALGAEEAKTLAGEKPELVPPDKRQEIIDKLKASVAYFRSCLDLQPQHTGARHNIELIRLWIKYYVDKWHELDRRKRRDESNLFQFVEYLRQAEGALRGAVQELKPDSSLDTYAEIKRAQEELAEEIDPLKQKMEKELGTVPAQQQQQGGAPQPDPKQVVEAIKKLEEWADGAGQQMAQASRALGQRKAPEAGDAQKAAVEEFERIWNVVVPFPALLARDLAEQTGIVTTLKPESAKNDDAAQNGDKKGNSAAPAAGAQPASGTANTSPKDEQGQTAVPAKPLGEITDPAAEMRELAELEEAVARRTTLLQMKAQMTLDQYEKLPPPPEKDENKGSSAAPAPPAPSAQSPAITPSPGSNASGQNQPGAGSAAPAAPGPDVQKIKDGLQKAIELAPKAAEKMTSATEALRQEKRAAAIPDAEEAKRILEEIDKAQPKPPEEKKDEKKDQDKKDQNKQDEQKKQQEKKDQEKKDQQKEKDKEKEKQEKMTRDRAEAQLRKVREREQDHRDMEARAHALRKEAPVDKDW